MATVTVTVTAEPAAAAEAGVPAAAGTTRTDDSAVAAAAGAAVAPWGPPLRPEDFDRTSTLTPAERAALRKHHAIGAVGEIAAATLTAPAAAAPPTGDPPALAERAAADPLARLVAPLESVHARLGVGPEVFQAARRVLWAEMRHRSRPFWAWTAADWHAICGPSVGAYTAHYRAHGAKDGRGRHHLLALAYLVGGLTDLRPCGLALACIPVARVAFGADAVDAAFGRVAGALYGHAGLGYAGSPSKRQRVQHVLALALLLNRSARLEDLSVGFLQRLATEVSVGTADVVRQLGRALEVLGLLSWPARAAARGVRETAAAGVPAAWAAWCWAWYQRATRLGTRPREEVVYILFAVGRWLAATHPTILTPEQWDEALALEYVHHLCTTARTGAEASPDGQERLARRDLLGKPLSPHAISGRLGSLRRAFSDWQDLPHAVAGEPPRKIPIRFKPQQALATPRRIKALIRPEPRDIDLALWYKLAYAAATLDAAVLAQHGRHYYAVALYRAVALLWVTAGRRTDELRRLRVGCVRREWDPAMRDEDGRPLDRSTDEPGHVGQRGEANSPGQTSQPGQTGELCYLHVPPNKTQGAFWIWIPSYTADAIEAWERERPTQQPARLDAKDNRRVDYLFQLRDRTVSGRFVNRSLIPLLCTMAGVPERDARGQLTAHRGRSTRATLLRRLGVPLADIAAYLGHANANTVRYYARTDDTQLALTIQRADERSRLVAALFDPQAAAAGQPSVFFSLGRGPDGQPRYCGNPAWASCAHRLACLKCRMYVGGTTAELLEARAGLIHLQATMPMTPEEQAAADGDVARLQTRLAELRHVPVPQPPSDAFIFNPEPAQPPSTPAGAAAPVPLPVPPPTDGDRRGFLTTRLADVRRDLAAAEQARKRTVLVRALRRELTTLESDLAALAPAAPPG